MTALDSVGDARISNASLAKLARTVIGANMVVAGGGSAYREEDNG